MLMQIDSLRPVTVARHMDNAVDEVLIDCTAWLRTYPDLTSYRVEIKSPQDVVYISASAKMDGDVLRWLITDSDTGVSGDGRYQVVATGVNGERKTSTPTLLRIKEIIPGTATETPPDPAKPWVDKVMDAAERAEAAAERAENAGGGGGSGGGGAPGEDGEDGGYYVPHVDANGNLSWTASDADMPAVAPVNIKGKPGEDGYTPIKGIDYRDGKDGKDAPQEAVLFVEQTLDAAQQTQARENIGAASNEELAQLSEEIVDLNKVAVKSINGAKPDENGNVQVEGGGSEGVYELIETITLEEAVNRVNLGPYNLKKVYVEVITPVADGDSAGVIAINDINAVYVSKMVAASSISANGRIIKCVADTENGMLRCFGHACNNSGYAQEGLSPLYQKAFAGYTAAKIETVSVFASLSAKTLPEGTVITIKGVRA